MPRPGSQTSRLRSYKGNDGSDRKAREAAGVGLAELQALDSLPSGLFQGFVLAAQPGPLTSSKAHCWQNHPGSLPWAVETQLDGDFVVPRVTGHTCHFVNAYSAPGTLHTWYLFNSHSGHTKKLLLLVHETEKSRSGTCPESDTFTAAGPAFEPGPCESSAHVFPGYRLQTSAVPGSGAAPSPGAPGGRGGRR